MNLNFRIYIIFFIISSSQLFSQNITKEEIYLTVSNVIANDTSRINTEGSNIIYISQTIENEWNQVIFESYAERSKENLNKCFSIYDKELDSIFTKNDIEFMEEQANNLSLKKWKNPFQNCEFQDINTKEYYEFSIPLFSIDKRTIIISFTGWTDMDSAFGGYFIYKKDSMGNFKFVTAKDFWIS
jgi:hypothetical protein